MRVNAHSELGASQYERWKECPGSVKLCRGIEKASSEHAERGTRAHEKAAEMLIKGELWDSSFEDMESIKVYLDHVESLRAQKPDFEAIEQRFHLDKLHPKLFGTADYVCYFKATKNLHVVDYKNGSGVGVEVSGEEGGNVQLLYYGGGGAHRK